MKDLSIIIAHYDPGNHPNCIESFHKTLQKIESQKEDNNIEIIIADDGSTTHGDIQSYGISERDDDKHIYYHLTSDKLDEWKKNNNFNYSTINHWLYLPKIKSTMSKARIGNIAIEIASSRNLFFLDDDNYFISNQTINAIQNLFSKYQLIIGQIKDNNGRLRPYSSNRVQGTTFGVKKTHLISAGLFGLWTEQVSCGVDSDIWWKLYYYFKNNPSLKACYTSEIQTLDSCSKRWKFHIKTLFHKRAIKKLFYENYGCNNYRDVTINPSREKTNWLENLT